MTSHFAPIVLFFLTIHRVSPVYARFTFQTHSASVHN